MTDNNKEITRVEQAIEGEVVTETDKRAKFIEFMARGYSRRAVAKEIHINKDTACKWAKELDKEIAEAKRDLLSDAYAQYGLSKASRIGRLGATINRLDEELATRDLSEVSTDKLLELRLKYDTALANEPEPTRTSTGQPHTIIRDAKGLMSELNNLYQRVKSGETTKEQARDELSVLMTIGRLYETTELEDKVSQLKQALIG